MKIEIIKETDQGGGPGLWDTCVDVVRSSSRGLMINNSITLHTANTSWATIKFRNNYTHLWTDITTKFTMLILYYPEYSLNIRCLGE